MSEHEAVLAYMAIVQRMPSYGVHYSDVKVCRCDGAPAVMYDWVWHTGQAWGAVEAGHQS